MTVKPKNRSLRNTELKQLYALSGNLCAYPGCENKIFEPARGEERAVQLGEAAHIIAFSPRGPRGSSGSRTSTGSEENHLLLCEKHHKIIDRREQTFTVDVLQEMKSVHERRVAEKLGKPPQPDSQILVTETVPSSLIAFEKMPTKIFSAPVLFNGWTEGEIARKLRYDLLGSSYAVFIVREGRLHSFNKLTLGACAYSDVVDTGAIEVLPAADMTDDPEWHRRYVRLLNLSIGKHLREDGIKFDRIHSRYYFTTENGRPRSGSYRTSTGQRSTRSLVWNPITKSTKMGKRFWWHLASSLHFDRYAENLWCLSIRPERHLTSDGTNLLNPQQVGRKVTSLKAHMYNDKYLDELVFWRDVLSRGRPDIVFGFGTQACQARAELLAVQAHWPSIDDKVRRYRGQPHSHDLFSMADIEELLGEPNEDD